MSEKSIEGLIEGIPNNNYPVSVRHVNGQIHVSFSGNPNRDRGELQNMLNYFLEKRYMFHGIVYINDANSDQIAEYKVLKIFKDSISISTDNQFLQSELDEIFL